MENNSGETKKIRKGLRVVMFLIIAALLFVYLNHVFTIGNSDSNKQIFNAFYAEEENTMDVVYIGTSATNRYFIPPKAYNDEGIAGFNLATMGLPMMFVPYLMDEVEKTQEPELYIIELRNILKSKNEVTDAHIRRVTDSMKPSKNKYAALDEALEYTEGATGELSNIDEGTLDYLVPIVKYHSRLASGDMGPEDLLPWKVKNQTKGYVLSIKTVTEKPQKEPVYSDGTAALAPEMEEALEDALDRCDEAVESGKEVLFVFSPYSMKKGDQEKFNTAIDIVTERGYTVLDFNQKEMTDELGLDWEKDLYNSKHVNYIGAEKYTEYLTEYLKANYDLPDRRGDAKYDSWAESYETYCDFVKDGIQEYK